MYYRKLTWKGWNYLKFMGIYSVYVSKSEYEEGKVKEVIKKAEEQDRLNKLRNS